MDLLKQAVCAYIFFITKGTQVIIYNTFYVWIGAMYTGSYKFFRSDEDKCRQATSSSPCT